MNEFLGEIEKMLASPMGEVRQSTNASYIPNAAFIEGCKACNGSGTFKSWSGRSVGQCFKCKGKGSKTFKSSPEARFSAKTKAAEKKTANKAAEIEAFKTAEPAVYEWLQSNTSFEFAVSLNSALYQWGSLTEGQLNAAKKCVAKLATMKAASAEKAVNAPTINVEQIEAAFANAKANGIKKPKLNLGSFKFSTAPATGKNAGSIYVKTGETYLGKVTGGKFFGAYACTEAQEAEVVAVASNPAEAAKAYGFRTGNCSCCGRLLTVGKSIELGIGPICFEKYGWT